jgi:hypothetical protein
VFQSILASFAFLGSGVRGLVSVASVARLEGSSGPVVGSCQVRWTERRDGNGNFMGKEGREVIRDRGRNKKGAVFWWFPEGSASRLRVVGK